MIDYIKNNLNLEKTITKDYIKEYSYPNIIEKIPYIIKNLSKQLGKDYKEIKPSIFVHKSVLIDANSKIIGPCIIGKNTEIRFGAYIRENVIIGSNCIIGNSTEIKNSILFDSVIVPHYNHIGNSLLGYKVHLGAGSIISNIKSDQSVVKLTINKEIYYPISKKIGSLIGDYVEIGCNSVLLPGSVIGKNTTVYPLVLVKGEIESNKIVKSTKEIIDKIIKKEIYFDFDETLFNTDKFYHEFLTICKNYNINEKSINLIKQKLFKNKLFNLEILVEYLIKRYNLSLEFKKEIKQLYSEKFVFKEVENCLEKLKKEYNLILLTNGDKEYQSAKIEGSKLSKYFFKIIITNDKTKLNIDYLKGLFIDNNPKEIKKLANMGAKVIRIRRKEDKYSLYDSDINCLEYSNLSDLIENEFNL